MKTDQLNEGRDLALTTDFRDVFAEVLRSTHGLSDTEAEMVFPDAGMKSVGLMG